MKWFLVIITFYQPHAQIQVQDVEMPSEQVCWETLRKFDDAWNGKDTNFHYSMTCEQREVEDK